MKLLFIFAFLGAAVAAPFDNDNIVGGNPCKNNSVPYQASLNAGYHFCGGSLIHERWVLSAANCYKPRIQVRLGEYNLMGVKAWEQLVLSEKVIRHPKYKTQFLDNNIMLIKLRDPAKLSSRIAPIGLGDGCAASGTNCLISRWSNKLSDGVNYHEVLQCLQAPVLHDTACRTAYPREITNNMLCVGAVAGGHDACEGNAGGSLACDGVVQGISSWRIGCGLPGYPGVYTKVCNYVDWILKTMNAN
ncbi:cationic trypsin-3-like [Anolis sagrei]|uniref:cationic trypsin-3-like n=1 Tax=Anolis sagrei TaxID=38937 RepID=UPI00351FFE6E